MLTPCLCFQPLILLPGQDGLLLAEQWLSAMAGVASQPRYIIEQLITVPVEKGGSVQQSATMMTSNMYRVIARGVGGTDTAVVILQSDYRR